MKSIMNGLYQPVALGGVCGSMAGAMTGDDAAVALLVEVVSIPSVSGAERDCAQLLCQRMAAMGYCAHVDESGSVVGVLGSERADAPEIVLLGHIDTVPGNIRVRIEEGRLYGRGSVDAKGPLVAFVVAAARAVLPEGVRVRLIGAVEEEVASSKGARHAAAVYRPVACIIGEPSGVDAVTLGYKGRLQATLEIGVADAHSAGPEKTAAEFACLAWASVEGAVRAARPGAVRVFDQLQAKLKSIACNDDGLMGRAVLNMSFRLPPGVGALEVERLCTSATRDLGTQHDWSFCAAEQAVVADRSNAVVRQLTGAIRAGGVVPRMKLKTGTADMNVVAPVWNCPIAAYGPGDSGLDHTPSEHVVVAEFLAAIGVLTRAVEGLAGEIAEQPPDGLPPK